MNFKPEWTPKTKIELLQRWILVQSFVYYELNENLVADHYYDENVNYLFELKKAYPDKWAASRYFDIFKEYEEGCTSGFELLEKTRALKPELFRIVHLDAVLALDERDRRATRLA